jgi:anthranilate 1,2-dioxygenase small subunit
LELFADPCSYYVIPRENQDRGLPAALIFCDTRAMLEDRILSLRSANKYNIHVDRHLIGLPRIIASTPDGLSIEAPFTIYQSGQEGDTRLFATGLYCDRLERASGRLKITEKKIVLDSFAVPSLLAAPL